MKLLVTYNGYCGRAEFVKGTPEVCAMAIAKEARHKAKGRMRDATVEMYAQEIAEALRKDAEDPNTNELVFSTYAMPYTVGINKGVCNKNILKVTVLDVFDDIQQAT